jgi:hypothetical protein
VLEGDLGDFSIAEVLQLLGFTKKTGRLQLHGPRAAGRMVVAEGSLVDITADVARIGVVRRLLGLGYVGPEPIYDLLDGTGELPSDRQVLKTLVERGHLDADLAAQVGRNHALESLAELLRWTEGSFRFDADPDAAEGMDPDEALPADAMMEEAKGRLEGWDALNERIGPGDQVVTLTSPLPPRDVTVPATGWGLLMFVDGQRTVDELAALSGRGSYDTRAALVDLLDQGLIALDDGAAVGEAGLAEALARIAELESAHHPGAAVDAAAAFGKGSREDDEAPQPAPPTDAPAEADAPAEIADATGDVAADAPTADAAPEAPPAGDEHHDQIPDQTSDQTPYQAPDPAPASLSSVDSGPTSVSQDDADNDDLSQGDSPVTDPRGLRTKVRGERLRTDPTIDEDLVSRLIDGVEGM